MSLTHPLLDAVGVRHGFGLRGEAPPEGLRAPRQVHGRAVVSAEACRADPPPAADAVVSREVAVAVGVVTADCVPVLLTTASGDTVAAAHAGWRGLAAGVLAQSVDAVRRSGGTVPVVAAIGPHIGACCYEVDAPVLDAMREAFGPEALRAAATSTRPGHARLDLGALAVTALTRSGLDGATIGVLPDSCTRCDAVRFHSYRRDGPGAGRLVHHIAARGPSGA